MAKKVFLWHRSNVSVLLALQLNFPKIQSNRLSNTLQIFSNSCGYKQLNWSVKIYCVDDKSNWKTIYRAREIEDIVTQNRCNRHQLSPCSNRNYEMWSIRYFQYTSNRDNTILNPLKPILGYSNTCTSISLLMIGKNKSAVINHHDQIHGKRMCGHYLSLSATGIDSFFIG